MIFASLFGAKAVAQTPHAFSSPALPAGSLSVETKRHMVEDAVAKLAKQLRVSTGQLRVLASTERTFPGIGQTAVTVKVLNEAASEPAGIAVDAEGTIVRLEQMEEEEDTKRRGREYKRIHPSLGEKIKKYKAGKHEDPIDVIIWLRVDESGDGIVAEPVSKVDLEHDMWAGVEDEVISAKVKAKRAAKVGPVLEKARGILRRFDPDVETDRYSPVLYSRLTPDQILEVSALPEVDTVYEDSISLPQLEVGRPTITADAVEGRGFTGGGVRVGVVEVGGRFAADNTFLNGAIQDPANVCAAGSLHTTGVAGVVRSTHNTRRGIAPGATLRVGGSCAGYTSQLQAAATASVNWGASALNASYGHNSNLVPDASARFYDDLVFNRFVTVAVSAGNEGGGCRSRTGNVTSPGLAYNVITVGNFDDRNSVGWADDIMDTCSSWRNPLSTNRDREKPEVAAPGTNINSTTTAPPWTGDIGSGTSFAAPMVTGLTALLIQRNAALRFWPEAIKAIVMTAAYHNIEGEARLSELDGAGGVDAQRADWIAAYRGGHGWQGWWSENYDCNAPSTYDIAELDLVAGWRTRVTMVWDQNPNYSDYKNRPSADLDLWIVNSGNEQDVQHSSSYDNTYEIVDFVPAASGPHKLRIAKFRCDMTPRYLAVAWRIGN